MNKFNIPIINPKSSNSTTRNFIWHFDIKLFFSINNIYFDKCYSRMIKSIKNSEANVLFGIHVNLRYNGKTDIRK